MLQGRGLRSNYFISSRVITFQIVVFCGYYLFVAFKLSGNPLEINTYPFSSWGMFSEVRDIRPYSIHKPYDESGVKWEVELSDRFKNLSPTLEKKLMWNFLQHRALAAKPVVDQPKIDAIVRQAYQFILNEVESSEDIKAIRMYHAFFRVPPYPEEPILTVVSKRLLGKYESNGELAAPKTTALRD